MPKISLTYESRGYLTLMVGPSGAGKTTFVDKYTALAGLTPPGMTHNPLHVSNFSRGDYPITIVRPDDIRGELTGDRANQSQNKQVFDIAHLRTAAALAVGDHVIFDATNLRESSRVYLVNFADCERFQYIILDRHNKTPWHGNMDVVRRHDLLFQEELPRILGGDGFGNALIHDLRYKFE